MASCRFFGCSRGGFLIDRDMLSIGKVITVRLWVLKKVATFSSMRFCLGLALATSKTLPLGSLLANGWYVPFKGSKDAG